MAAAKKSAKKRAREACGTVIGEVKLKTSNGLVIAKPKRSKPKTKKDKTGKSTAVKKKAKPKKSAKPKTKKDKKGASVAVKKAAKKGAKKATKKTAKKRAKKRGETAAENKAISQAKKDAKKATPKKGAKKSAAKKARAKAAAVYGPLTPAQAEKRDKAQATSGKRAAKKLSKFFDKLGKEIQKREKQQSSTETRAKLASSDAMKTKLANFRMKRNIAKAMKNVDAAAEAANVPESLTPATLTNDTKGDYALFLKGAGKAKKARKK